jgi:hypothetical protein
MLNSGRTCNEIFRFLTLPEVPDGDLQQYIDAGLADPMFPNRPNALLIGITLMMPPVIPCFFAAFYFKFFWERHEREKTDKATRAGIRRKMRADYASYAATSDYRSKYANSFAATSQASVIESSDS